MPGLEGTRFQDRISGILILSLLPHGFLLFRPTKQNCQRERERGQKKKANQASTPNCLFLSGEQKFLTGNRKCLGESEML